MTVDEYQVNIDLDKLINRQRPIPNIGSMVEKALENALVEMKELTLEEMRRIMTTYDLDYSTLIYDLKVEMLDTGISISTDSDHAVFVEYGTGFAGYNEPHPQASKNGWIYMSGEHSSNPSGWWYPTNASDPNPTLTWFKETDEYEAGWYAFTRGLPSRPYMYQTWLWATRSINNIIRKHINRAIKEWESDVNGG